MERRLSILGNFVTWGIFESCREEFLVVSQNTAVHSRYNNKPAGQDIYSTEGSASLDAGW